MIDLSTLKTQPLGFGSCRRCPYFETGSPELCFSCARKHMQGLAENTCRVCDLPVDLNTGDCGNPICNDYPHRWFEWNYAIAMRSGGLRRTIDNYKFSGLTYWAAIFGRVLVGFLEDESELFSKFDLIVASPSFVTNDGSGRSWDHTRLVIEAADAEGPGEWPFDVYADPPAIIKTAATPRMSRQDSWRQRKEIAEGPLRDALQIPDPVATDGKRILVYDDIFTDGLTLNEVARCLLLNGGAKDVYGITLARQPFTRRI